MKQTLQSDVGVTDFSLGNAEVLVAEHGQPNLVKLWWDEDTWHRVTVEWPDNYKHTFGGFAWGYRGASPFGLARFAKFIGLGDLLTLDMIVGLPKKTEKLFRFAPQTSGGKPEWGWA